MGVGVGWWGWRVAGGSVFGVWRDGVGWAGVVWGGVGVAAATPQLGSEGFANDSLYDSLSSTRTHMQWCLWTFVTAFTISAAFQ